MTPERWNVSGQAYALTVVTPILRGHESALSRHLDALPSRDGSPLARVPGTHFARWVVMDNLVYEGGSQRREHLKAGRLLFTSNFDGQLGPYLELLRTGLGEDADAIWKHCAGYPGHEDAAGFATYMRRHQVGSSMFFAAYGEQPVEQVRTNLAQRRRLIEFALRTQGMEAGALQAAFLAEFPA